ncbi:hypothetical protein Q1695_003583 [Nippostrongylus brasiliensis]|nr:hypothetical protein Q1695_003583 [Nippostrongylus brasiliensis]
MAKKKRLSPKTWWLRYAQLLKASAVFIVVWSVTVIYFWRTDIPETKSVPIRGDPEELQDQIEEFIRQRKELREVNAELKIKLDAALEERQSALRKLSDLFEKEKSRNSSYEKYHFFPEQQELIRRRIARKLLENFHWVRHLFTENSVNVTRVKSFFTEQIISQYSDILLLSQVDGAAEWRRQALQDLTSDIQRKLNTSQNPMDCESAKFIVCDLRECGFGCQVHHLAYCLLVAFASQRTLIFGKNQTWSYHNQGWQAVFKPLSKCRPLQVQEKILGRKLTRRVYVSSDDRTALPEIEMKYPNYKVFGSVLSAESSLPENRYSERSLRGLLADLISLSKCSYIVCTFSSHFCRLAYELMQIRQGDVGEYFHSLDEDYYFGNATNTYAAAAVEDHEPSGEQEINMKIGDQIEVLMNHRNGFATVVNTRSGEEGQIPLFKVEKLWKVVDFPALNSPTT